MDLPDWDQSKPDPGHYPAILRPFAQRPLWLDSSPPRPIVAVCTALSGQSEGMDE